MHVSLWFIFVVAVFHDFHGEDRSNFMGTTSAVIGELRPHLSDGDPRESAAFLSPVPGYTDHS